MWTLKWTLNSGLIALSLLPTTTSLPHFLSHVSLLKSIGSSCTTRNIFFLCSFLHNRDKRGMTVLHLALERKMFSRARILMNFHGYVSFGKYWLCSHNDFQCVMVAHWWSKGVPHLCYTRLSHKDMAYTYWMPSLTTYQWSDYNPPQTDVVRTKMEKAVCTLHLTKQLPKRS